MNSLNQSILRPYFDAILAERDWSWSCVAILYILSGLVIRGWFTGTLENYARGLNRKFRRAVKKAYLKRALLGWVFFLIPAVLLTVLWQDRPLPEKIERVHLIAAAGVSYVLSIVLHVRALGIAGVLTLKQLSENDQQKKFLEG